MNINKTFAINTGFVFSLVFLFAMIYLSHSFMVHLTKQDNDETSVSSLIMTLDELQKSLRAERTAQRGFAETHDQQYVREYRQASQRVASVLTDLEFMTNDKAGYGAKLAGIKALIQKRQEAFNEAIEGGHLSTATREMIRDILERVSAMRQQAIHDLHDTSARERRYLNVLWYMLIANSLLVFVLFSTVFVLLRKDIARRTWEELELKRNRDQLDELVKQRTEELQTTNQLLQDEMLVRRHTEDALHNLTQHLELIREDERIAISRDIHDEIGQSLTALKLNLAWMERKFLPGNSEFIGRLNLMRSVLDRLIGTAQNIIANLRPPLLDNLGFLEALEWQISEFKHQNGITCNLNLDRRINGLDEKTSTAVIRILMEALTNISRHARATFVNVSLVKKEECIILEISDNGRGISTEELNSPTSFGVMGMKERAHLVGGILTFTGIPGEGTTVRLSIPLNTCRSNHETNTAC